MRVIMFQPRFAPLVESGKKRQTVRVDARCKAGDELSLREWTGKPYRSKQRELMRTRAIHVGNARIYRHCMSLDGMVVSAKEADAFAKRDGFLNFEELAWWFGNSHGLPFNGDYIQWEAKP